MPVIRPVRERRSRAMVVVNDEPSALPRPTIVRASYGRASDYWCPALPVARIVGASWWLVTVTRVLAWLRS